MADERTSIAPGPVGLRVAGMIRRARTQKEVSYADMTRRLELSGRPIAPLGLARMEKGTRRIDVDDLFAIAAALDVSPALLLADGTQLCAVCWDRPPCGFTCNACGKAGAVP